MKQSNQKYSFETKTKIIEMYLSGRSKNSLINEFKLGGYVTISRWMRTFGIPEITLPLTEMKEKELKDLLESKKKIKELEAKLKLAEMKADAYNTMIDVAEEMFQIPIRKKPGTKQ